MMASSMLLFTEAFGPEIDTSPGSKIIMLFLKPNDLKPKISTLLI
jgi:hypothetical protein